MPRNLTAGMLAEIAKSNVVPRFFVELVAVTTVRFWTGKDTKTWNGVPWTGAGHVLSISDVEEGQDLKARGLRFALTGVDPTLQSLVRAETKQGQPIRMWLALMDGTDTPIDDPYFAFNGRLDVPSVRDSGDAIIITVTAENRGRALGRARERRYTDEDQKALFPNDTGLSRVTELPDRTITWRG